MSNYRPDVTEVDLPDHSSWEGAITRKCELPGKVKVLPPYVEIWMPRFGRVMDPAVAANAWARMLLELENAYEIEIDECPFAGEVDAYMARGSLLWTCPICQQLHEETE